MKLLFKINISPNHVYNNRGQNFKSQNKKQNDKNSRINFSRSVLLKTNLNFLKLTFVTRCTPEIQPDISEN